jgi:flagellar protein FlaG
MAQFSVTPVSTLAVTPTASAPVSPRSASPAPASATLADLTKEERALNRSVSAAVQTLNNAGYAGGGREVTFSVDQATRRPVVKVVEISTKEVLLQWPAEYALELAASTDKLTRDSG